MRRLLKAPKNAAMGLRPLSSLVAATRLGQGKMLTVSTTVIAPTVTFCNQARFYCDGTGSNTGNHQQQQQQSLSPLHQRCKEIIEQDRIVVFLTGTPQQPRCRFTAMLMDIFNQIGLENFSFYDILEDDEVCEGLKEYSSWPTYPQIYIDRELIGGYDVCREMFADGSLVKLLNEKKLLE